MKLSYQYLNSQNNQYAINNFWITDNAFGVHWHYHQEIEICFIHQGYGHRIVGDSVHRFENGDLVLLGKNIPHCWVTDKSFNESDELIKAFVIQFNQGIFSKSVAAFNKINEILDLAQKGISFNINNNDKLLKALLAIDTNNDIDKYAKLLSLLNLMIIDHSKNLLSSSNYSIEKSNKTEARITKVCTYIQERYKQNITLHELAEIASMNAASFSRFFKKHIGKSPIKYINDVRINIACTYLVNTKSKVYEIAYDVGFHSVSHFNKLFLKHIGLTPKDYRKSILPS